MSERSYASHVRIVDVAIAFQTFLYRQAMKFGGNVVTAATVLDARVTVENQSGARAIGLGSMPLGNVWGWPPGRNNLVPPAVSLDAMTLLAHDMARSIGQYNQYGHPVDIMHDIEPDLLGLARDVCNRIHTPAPMPPLAAHVVASPFASALFDGFGKVNGAHAFRLLGPEHMPHDLAYYVGKVEIPGLSTESLRGRYLDRYVRTGPKRSVPLYHLVGALDPLTNADVTNRVDDGRPNSLVEYLMGDEKLSHLKIKLNGTNLNWDVERILAVSRIATECNADQVWTFSLDFNECAPNVEYLIDVLQRVRTGSNLAFNRVAYVEQPTSRDLNALPLNPMHEAAKIKPVVIDESLVDIQSLADARRLGYTGIALKACKGMGNALISAALAIESGMFLCVQDLTCPGRSFAHSALLAAWIDQCTAIEGNSRQYLPAANREWEAELPELFVVRNGRIITANLNHPGLGLLL